MTEYVKSAGRRRIALYNEMLPAAQATTAALDKNRRRFHRGKGLVHYDIGRQLLPVLANPKIYGADALCQIAEYLDIEVDRLHTFRDVAEAFDRGFIEREIEMPMACGRFLDIAYFAELVPLRNDEEQIALALRHIREGNLSLAEVHTLVRQVLLGHRLTRRDA